MLAFAIAALGVSDKIKSLGAIAGFAAVLGVGVLAALYFGQARELKRLREWAGRAPERAAEMQERIASDAATRAGSPRTVVAQPGRPATATPVTAAGSAAAVPAAGAVGASPPVVPAPATAGAAGGTGAAVPATPPDVTGATGAAAGATGAAPGATGAAPVAAGETGGTPPAAVPPGATAAAPPTPPPATPAAANPAPPDDATQAIPAVPAVPAPATPAARPAPAVPLRTATSSAPIGTRRASSVPKPAAKAPVAEHSPARATWTVVGGVAAAAAIIALLVTQVFAGGDDGDKTSSIPAATTTGAVTTTAGATTTAKTTPTQAPLVRSSISYAVLNATLTNQLARSVGDKLQASGYTKQLRIKQASQTGRPTTIVAYSPGKKRAALDIARILTVTPANVIPIASDAIASGEGADADVVVVMGADKAQA